MLERYPSLFIAYTAIFLTTPLEMCPYVGYKLVTIGLVLL